MDNYHYVVLKWGFSVLWEIPLANCPLFTFLSSNYSELIYIIYRSIFTNMYRKDAGLSSCFSTLINPSCLIETTYVYFLYMLLYIFIVSIYMYKYIVFICITSYDYLLVYTHRDIFWKDTGLLPITSAWTNLSSMVKKWNYKFTSSKHNQHISIFMCILYLYIMLLKLLECVCSQIETDVCG